jgi:DNA-binding protein HU-beta
MLYSNGQCSIKEYFYQHNGGANMATAKVVLGKTDLVDLIASTSKMSKVDSSAALNAVLDAIEKALSKGNDVNITGFGKFKVARRAAREGRNPSTGAKLQIKASNQVGFSVGAGLKASVNK